MSRALPAAKALVIAWSLSSGAGVMAADWAQLGGGPTHAAISATAPNNLNSVRWIAAPLADEEFVAYAAPVIRKGRVFIPARVFVDFAHDSNAVICFDERTGARLWKTTIPADFHESWSTLAIHGLNSTIIAATDRTITALNAGDGAMCWSVEPGGRIVNSSPTISVDLFAANKPANRIFITNFYAAPGGGSPAVVYAINVDEFDGDGNPYQPGEVVWSVPIDRPQGSTIAYHDGAVFVATTTGKVYSLDACSGKQNWLQTVAGLRCFGGVTVCGGAVFTAGYNFNAGQNNALLAKLSESDGSLIWTVPCERTNSIPVVIGDGRIALAGGIGGSFGSATKVQLFADNGSSAALIWDTHVATGGTLSVGGWSTHPVFARGSLFVGQPATSGEIAPFEKLFILNLGYAPGQPGFVGGERTGAGGSPAFSGQCVYSIGSAGLVALGRPLAVASP